MKDVQELKEIEAAEVKESKAARRLFKVVNKLIGKLDNHVSKLETQEAAIKKDLETIQDNKSQDSEVARDELLRIDELINVIRKIQTVPDNSRLDRISEVLDKMDADHDGAIRIDTVLKVVELIGNENLKLNNKQMTEIIDLIKKEEQITLQEQLEKMLEKDAVKERSAAETVQPPTVESLVKPAPESREDTIKEKPKPIEEVSRETLQNQKLAAMAKPPTTEPATMVDQKKSDTFRSP